MIGQAKPNGSTQTSHGWGDADVPEGWIGPNPWDHPLEPLDPIDPATTDIPPYERPWLIENWFPLNETVGLGGPGGKGKTLLAHMLACAAAAGASWLGLPVTRMKSALILCEDRHDDVMWRQRDINRRHQTPPGRVRIYPRRDHNHNFLAVFDRDGELHQTTFFLQLLAELIAWADRQPLLTILDTRADVFWGNQNDERHARMFVRKICDRIARDTNGIVILIYQPSVTGMQSGAGTSGSVQWDAAFRARLYLENAEDTDDTLRRTLTLVKANHAEPDQTLDIRWDKGCFIRQEEFDASKADFEIAAERGKFKDLFKTEFAKRKPSMHPLTDNDKSPYYAPKCLAKDYRLANTTAKAKVKNLDAGLARAMKDLLDSGEFRCDAINLNHRHFTVIVPAHTPPH